ncbi:MAG: hypothetical protein JST04_06015 [Bdellovibrionales bacterium]|nr:hypothetical protein [Bdellovibrionales bacterium]
MKKVNLAVGISLSLLLVGAVRADDLISLDDPAPAPAAPAKPAAAPGKAGAKTAAPSAPAAGGLESLDSLDGSTGDGSATAGDDSVDLGAGSGDDGEISLDAGEPAFNPYTFARTEAWSFLPIGALILVGLHLLRVPKRKSKRKLDQARRFFRGISGEGTNSSILIPPKPKDGNN